MMYGKMKDKMPMKGSKEEPMMEKKKPMAGIEIEIEGDDEPEGEESLPSESEGEGMDEEVSVGELAKFSDEELKAELEKRGMTTSEAPAEGPSTSESESESESEEPMPMLKKKPAKA